MRRLNQLNATHFNSMRVSRIIESNMRLNFDSWFKRRILHVPNWIEIKLNNLCLLEWEFNTRHSRSAILFGKTMRRLNQISRMYSFESTKISIWFGACKMRRLNQALELSNKLALKGNIGLPKYTNMASFLWQLHNAYTCKRLHCWSLSSHRWSG